MRWNENTGRAPRLLVADSQPMVAEALAALLQARGYEIAARAHDGASAETALAAGGIDVAILDIDLADPGPAQLFDRLRGRGDHVPIIVTAPCGNHHGVAAIIDSRTDGLVLKSESASDLADCLAVVAAGGQWLDRTAMASARHRSMTETGADTLTRRERDVALLVATGRRNREIAGELGISEGTVKMHLHNVYAKFGVGSRTQLAMDARLKLLNQGFGVSGTSKVAMTRPRTSTSIIR